MNSLINSMGEERFIQDRGETKECLAACVDQTHAFLVTQASYPNQQAYYNSGEFCVVVHKLERSCAGDRREALEEVYPELCNDLQDAIDAGFECAEDVLFREGDEGYIEGTSITGKKQLPLAVFDVRQWGLSIFNLLDCLDVKNSFSLDSFNL